MIVACSPDIRDSDAVRDSVARRYALLLRVEISKASAAWVEILVAKKVIVHAIAIRINCVIILRT